MGAGTLVLDRRRRAVVMQSVWLVYLIFPLWDLIHLPLSVPQRAFGVLGLAIFVWSYLRVIGTGWPRSGMHLGLELALGLALSMFVAPSCVACFVYTASSATWLPDGRFRLLGWLLALAGLAGTAVSGRISPGQAGTMVILLVVVGVFITFFRRFQEIECRLESEHAFRVRTEERDRIARDLHDMLGHTLSLMVLKSQLAARLAREDPERAVAECADLEAEARRALEQMRTVTAGFRSHPLPEAIEEAERLCAAAGIAYRASSPPPLPAAVEGVLGLVLREAVTNGVRHSGARHCWVEFRGGDGAIEMTVGDDGRGFAVDRRVSGNGLRGMRERLAAVGGTLEVTSHPGSGTLVKTWMPVA